jgi:hypothetical protein
MQQIGVLLDDVLIVSIFFDHFLVVRMALRGGTCFDAFAHSYIDP